jgi:hypothetical protein
MTRLTERPSKLKELLVMMESEPLKFAQEDLCDPRLLTKLLPEGSELAIANDPSPRKRTKTTLRLKVLDYIANDILKWNRDAILGSLFFWEMYLNRPEVGQYRKISLDKVVDYWFDPGSLIDFMDGPVNQYRKGSQKKEFIRSFQEINTPGKGISLLLNCILPNSKQKRTNQVRGLENFLNATADRLELEIERVPLEILGVSALAMPQGDPLKTVLPLLDIFPCLREFMHRNCKNLFPDRGIEITDKTAIYRTIESDTGAICSGRIEVFNLFLNASGVLVSPPHTGKTTYVKMLVSKYTEAETDCIAVYIQALDLKVYALLKRSVYDFLANRLVEEGLADLENFDAVASALQQADRRGKLSFSVTIRKT